MPSKTFCQVKKEAVQIINCASQITVIDREIDIISDYYHKAKEKIEKVSTYLIETAPKLKTSGFEKKIIEISIEAAVNALWESAQEEYYNMIEQRYSDIIKIFKDGSKESNIK